MAAAAGSGLPITGEGSAFHPEARIFAHVSAVAKPRQFVARAGTVFRRLRSQPCPFLFSSCPWPCRSSTGWRARRDSAALRHLRVRLARQAGGYGHDLPQIWPSRKSGRFSLPSRNACVPSHSKLAAAVAAFPRPPVLQSV